MVAGDVNNESNLIALSSNIAIAEEVPDREALFDVDDRELELVGAPRLNFTLAKGRLRPSATISRDLARLRTAKSHTGLI